MDISSRSSPPKFLDCAHASPGHFSVLTARWVNRLRSLPLACGLRLGVEGSVVGDLVLGRGNVAQRAAQAPVVVTADPSGGGILDVANGLVRPGVEDRRADPLGLVQAVDAPRQGVESPMSSSVRKGLPGFG